ncbi:hypothetical protein BST92_04805 [Nonlabens arenilitoris]|uniref:Uncharacterized protein n=2 Tax=Nonlabens TaxID=363408 RepID=A0A2S7UA56_9FLAO|nr:hypothetical protein BST92_04805 [Nonlabens arenilitoris]
MCLCAMLLLCTISCENDDSPECQGIDCLPPITQTGAGTFGCLVNGEPYFAFGGVNAQYQLVNGSYNLLIGFDRDVGFPESISIIGNGQINENGQYILGDPTNEILFGNIVFSYNEQSLEFNENTTSNLHLGTTTITKLDETNQIISGTFEFEILNLENNQVYQITEGRFDSFYTN